MSAELLLLAIGNPLRGDDGVARAVVGHVARTAPVEVLCVHQLAPEHAAAIAECDAVVFVDADAAGERVAVEEMTALPLARSLLGHAMGPEEIVALARVACGFAGRAWLCRVPVREFGEGEGLSEAAERAAAEAAERLEELARRFAGAAR